MKFDLSTLHPNFFTEDNRANGRAIFQWSINHFTPLTYHRPEQYVKCLVNYIIRREQLANTPEFTTANNRRLSTIRTILKQPDCDNRLKLTHEKHQLEARQENCAYAYGMAFGAEIELRRAKRRLTQIDITYIHDLLIMSAQEERSPQLPKTLINPYTGSEMVIL